MNRRNGRWTSGALIDCGLSMQKLDRDFVINNTTQMRRKDFAGGKKGSVRLTVKTRVFCRTARHKTWAVHATVLSHGFLHPIAANHDLRPDGQRWARSHRGFHGAVCRASDRAASMM